jgi:hypothetical protein
MAMADLQPGEVFAGYRIERRVGAGGMGVVYEALEPALDRRVALKLIATDAARDATFRERFETESRIAARVEHPNLVPIYAVGEQEGVPFLAMRLMTGPNLGELIASLRRLEPSDAAVVVGKVAAGLDAIHAAGLIHRDVKPANVLLSGPKVREDVYLTDFGIARHLAQTSELTPGSQVLGTLDYVAPELIDQGPVDARCDVYSLGCVLYKALTGEVPFPAQDVPAKLWAHLNADPPTPSHTAGVPDGFDEVVARALAKRPEDRYPTAVDLGRATLAAAKGEPLPAVEAPRPAASTPAPAEAPTRPLGAGSGAAPGPARSSPRVRRLRPLLLVAAVVAAAWTPFLIGELGGDDTPEAAERLIERADQICVESRRQYARVAAKAPGSRSDAVDQYEQLQRISARALDRLRALPVPADLSRRYTAYMAQRQLMVFQLGAARDAVADGDVEALTNALARIDAQAPLRQQTATDIGLQKCSGAG